MTDINLNPQLTARLRAVQQHWGHDNIAETVALILDAAVHKWDIPIPNSPHITVDKNTRVRLRNRHVAYFSQMSLMSGLGVTELARSVLIQWVCLPQNTLLLPENTQSSPQNRQPLPKTSNKSSDNTHKRPKKTLPVANQETKQPEVKQSSPQNNETSPQNVETSTKSNETITEQVNSSAKKTGRELLSGLMSKK